MTERHYVSIIGKNQGLILITNGYDDQIHLNFIRKEMDHFKV